MNIYVVTEGKTEKTVYKRWIPLVNPALHVIDELSDLTENCVYIFSAEGFPGYFSTIDAAIEDVNNDRSGFSRLVVAVDSEEMTRPDKYIEVHNHIGTKCRAQVRIVIQHFCFETWALGNRTLVKRHPSAGRLLEYKRYYDVRQNDPELLPAKPDENLNRSQFSQKYLSVALNERHKTMTYSKSNPRALLHEKYFSEVKARLDETSHISSFRDFIEAFS